MLCCPRQVNKIWVRLWANRPFLCTPQTPLQGIQGSWRHENIKGMIELTSYSSLTQWSLFLSTCSWDALPESVCRHNSPHVPDICFLVSLMSPLLSNGIMTNQSWKVPVLFSVQCIRYQGEIKSKQTIAWNKLWGTVPNTWLCLSCVCGWHTVRF